MIYDTHAHLNLNYSDEEIDDLINESKKNKLFVNIIGVDLETSIQAIELAKKNPNYFFAILGIHPNSAALLTKAEIDKTIIEFEKLIENNLDHIKGIGETGVDHFITKDDSKKEMQLYSLEKHFNLVKKYNIPLILHVRDAHEEMINFLEKNKHDKVLIHCYSDNLNYAKKYIELGCKLSIPGIVTFKNAIELKEAVKEIDIKNLLVETDSPFLTPMPFRGKKNSPLYVEYVIKEIAKIKEIDELEVKKEIFKNSLLFFNI